MPGEDPKTLMDRLKQAKRLPSPVGVALRVLELCRNPDTEMQEIATIVMADPALSGRLLKYANSASVGVGREVSSIQEAILLMGLRAVKLTSLGFALVANTAEPPCPGFDMSRFWNESFVRGTIARGIAKDHFKSDREEAFTAALLCKIAMLALAQGMPEEYQRVLEAVDRGRPCSEAEQEFLGVTHTEFGAVLLKDWDLPDSLVAAVQFQDHPDAAAEEYRALARTIHAAVRLSPLFAPAGDGPVSRSMLEDARAVVDDILKLDKDAWKATSDEILADYQQVSDLFDVTMEDPTKVIDLYADAQEEATRVGMVVQLEQNRMIARNRELLQKATTDQLTGIANRAKFDERFEELGSGVKCGHGDFACLIMDIDHFKKFNDSYGHRFGDLVLQRVARTLQNSMREADLVARYGGEEFAVLAPQTDRKSACIIAARICKNIGQLRVEVGGETIGVTISVGLAMSADYPDPPTCEQLIVDADKQLYLSKNNGRNTWSYLNRVANQFCRAAAAEPDGAEAEREDATAERTAA